MKQERATLKAVQDFLEMKGILYVRINPISPVGPGRWRRIRASQKGAPDLIFFLRGCVYAIELKAAKGVLSDSQKDWGKRARKAEISYTVHRNFQDFADCFCALEQVGAA